MENPYLETAQAARAYFRKKDDERKARQQATLDKGMELWAVFAPIMCDELRLAVLARDAGKRCPMNYGNADEPVFRAYSYLEVDHFGLHGYGTVIGVAVRPAYLEFQLSPTGHVSTTRHNSVLYLPEHNRSEAEIRHQIRLYLLEPALEGCLKQGRHDLFGELLGDGEKFNIQK